MGIVFCKHGHQARPQERQTLGRRQRAREEIVSLIGSVSKRGEDHEPTLVAQHHVGWVVEKRLHVEILTARRDEGQHLRLVDDVVEKADRVADHLGAPCDAAMVACTHASSALSCSALARASP